MHPLMGQEIASLRTSEMQRQAEQSRMVKQAKAARRNARRSGAESTAPLGRITLAWRAVARGRAVGKVQASQVRRAPPAAGCY
jgi:hypothetical protein